MILFALLLALASLGVSLVLASCLRSLSARLVLLEKQPKMAPLEERKGEMWGRGLEGVNPLAGFRIAFAIQQDHPHPVFANLLKEALLREEALVDDVEPDLKIEGEVVGNGYADVYFRAELAARVGEETIFALSDKPPHGDRPANLAAEVVQRLKEEVGKRERRAAVRELHEPG